MEDEQTRVLELFLQKTHNELIDYLQWMFEFKLPHIHIFILW